MRAKRSSVFLRKPLAMALAASVFLSGCVTTGYNAQVSGTVDSAKVGSVDLALDNLEKNNPGKDKDLLYFLEKGELLRMKGDYPSSVNQWMVADSKVREWEEAVKTDPSKVMGQVGSFIVNDTMRRYDGRDYEKVLLSVRLALDHVAMGRWDDARVEIKKMHEREAIIADFRSKDLDDAKKSADAKGVKVSSFKDINGYPAETLNAPEVVALKNAYESAVANYLAGFVYEALGEPSLAAAGYRKAIEMRSGDAFLSEALAGLDARVGKRSLTQGVDTLFVFESGNAPRITSRLLPIPLPIPHKNGLQVVMTPISWPVVENADVAYIPASFGLDDKTLPLTLVTSVDHMARRAISDEMPGIIARSAVRAIVKGAAQKAIQDNSGGGVAGALLSVAAGVAAVASEKADERTWRTLPATFSLGRAVLPYGNHKLTLNTPLGLVSKDIQLSGPHAVVVVRTTGNAVYVNQTPYDPDLKPPVVQAEQKDVLPKGKGKGDAKGKAKAEAKPKAKVKADEAAANAK